MKQDEIMEMARKATLDEMWELSPRFVARLEAFAKLVAEQVKDAMTEQHMNDIWQAIKIERERIIKANKLELDKCNAYIKELEDRLARGEA